MSKRGKRYTKVPKEFIGIDLFDWGRGGLRFRGNHFISADGTRPRKTFNDDWLEDFTKVRAGMSTMGVIRESYKLTKEIWPIFVRKGRYWKRMFYLVPTQILEQAKIITQNRNRNGTGYAIKRGQVLRGIRNDLGLSLSQVVEDLKGAVSVSALWKIEKGLVEKPTQETMQTILAYYKLDCFRLQEATLLDNLPF